MTTEQKAKAYDEAIKVIKENLDALNEINGTGAVNIQAIKNCFYRAFPELKESEDEKVEKAIFGMVYDSDNELWSSYDVSKSDVLSWLENQGEKKPKKVSLWKHWKDGITGNGEGKTIYLVKVGDTYSLNSCLCFECDYIELSELDKLLSEKQGEQKPDNYIPKFCVGDLVVSTKNKHLTYKVLEVGHINEKGELEYKVEIFADGKSDNPSNIKYIRCQMMDVWATLIEQKYDVEPKFKVGDWIINNEHNNVVKVLEINNGQYRLDYGDTVGTICIELIDNDYHLWTIQDAKDGDVLAIEPIKESYLYPFVAIYKERGSNFFNSYCSIGFNGIFYIGDCGHDINVHPATKEQCDLLFAKMKEEGYIWDVEKKELKKISQEYPLTSDECIKSAWCEEDSRKIGTLSAIISDYAFYKDALDENNDLTGEYAELDNWLGYLPERFNLQPEQEWSEEDKNAVQVLKNIVKKSEIIDSIIYTNSLKEKLYDWLKSLKQRIGE